MTKRSTLSRLVDWISDGVFPNAESSEFPIGQGVVSEIEAICSEIDRLKCENAELRSELARVKEAAELLAEYVVADDDQHKNPMIDTLHYIRASKRLAVDANPTAAALVEQARKEKV